MRRRAGIMAESRSPSGIAPTEEEPTSPVETRPSQRTSEARLESGRPARTGLAGFVRSVPPFVRVPVAVATLPVWATSEIQQSSLGKRTRYAALTVVWAAIAATVVLVLSLALNDGRKTAVLTPPPVLTETPTSPPSAAPTVTPLLSASPVPALVDKECSDFVSPEEAQSFFKESGGPKQDLHGLDPNRNGVACDEGTGPSASPKTTPAATSTMQ